jgi:opacity protein-like surface antigen
LNDKTLVSFNAGVARSKISQSNVRDPLNYRALQSDTSSATEYGFVYGLSGEYKITPQLSLRADYEVVDFGDVSRTMVNGRNGVFYDNNKIKFDNVSIGLVYSF